MPIPGVLQITIDRGGRRNAINTAGFRQLAAAWDELESSEARVAVITGTSGDFSSGADLASIATDVAEETRDGRGEEIWRVMRRAVLRDQNLSKPVVAAIEGICFGGGMELVGGTDVRIAGRSARFALPEVRHGVVPSGGSLARLARQVPYALAMQILLTGSEQSAERMAAAGYIGSVVENGQALTSALEVARQIADNAPAAVRAVKRAVSLGLRGSLADAYLIEADVEQTVMLGDEAREGAAALIAKRPPAWRLAD